MGWRIDEGFKSGKSQDNKIRKIHISYSVVRIEKRILKLSFVKKDCEICAGGEFGTEKM